MKNRIVIFIVIIAVVLTASLSVVGTLSLVTILENRQDRYYITFDSSVVDAANIDKFNEVRDLLYEKYMGEIDENILLEGVIAGMVGALGDPYTMYVDAETMALMEADSEGEYSGIGVTITIPNEGSGILILDVNELGPAFESGILAGDRVIRVDEYDVAFSDDLNYVASLVRGEAGSDVEIEIIRENETKSLVFNITRRTVNSIDVTGDMPDEKIGYIKIKSFTQDSPEEFANVFNDLVGQGMESLVMDVRDNPGGSLYAIINIADMIMEEGIITYTVDRDGNREDYTAARGGVSLPIVILVNEYSASASEMLAGALRDNGLATVVGTTTFGKGLVQGVYNLEDGSGLRITIAKYYTPSDVCIQDIGIVPDFEIEQAGDYQGMPVSAVPREDDLQFIKALEILKGNE
ncbi:MAG: S41 family peptidase [Clostridia bacterium]|nr:S41 family peptidase [Clostridia bacterium]